ncbi:MAG: [FeFe] hydrogenase H-cluster radical SAM maturase HydG [Halanaerobiaceae bacterium]
MSKPLREILELKNIETVLAETESPGDDEFEQIITKALELEGLNELEVASLLKIESPDKIEKLLETAGKIKEEIYGKRLVVFAPLYLDNYCSNNCLYCGYRAPNKELTRKELSELELKSEVKALLKTGQKRLLVLTGERNSSNIDNLLEKIDKIYEVDGENPGEEVKRINLEIAPLTEEEFARVSNSKIGTYTCFQETYHLPTYNQMHLSGRKSDYDWRLEVMDRAVKGGIDDYGIGVLFGLYDYKYEVLAMLRHANYLDRKYGVGPHTVSVPRFKPAAGAEITEAPYPVSDDDFKLLIAIIRMALPYTGMILSTREPVQLRNKLFKYGISQISAGSCTSPGGYNEKEKETGQFKLYDNRNLEEIVSEAVQAGYLPSFCTSCYRKARTGKDFMELAKPGDIKPYCQANALLTLAEYLINYASEQLQQDGFELIEQKIAEIKEDNYGLAAKISNKLDQLKDDNYDLYF